MRCYFNLVSSHHTITDEEGLEVADADEARTFVREAVATRCGARMDEITFRSTITRVGDPALDDARQMALAAIDDLEERLALARPSNRANILGIGW